MNAMKLPVRFAQVASEEGLKRALFETQDFINFKLDKIARKSLSSFFEYRFGPGIDVMKQDWDNLIILDACRYDYFKSYNNIDGDLRSVISQGAHSWEFMQENFVGREFHDTVYVTANPHVGKLDDDIFYTVEQLLDDWDENLGAVHPDYVVEAAFEAYNKYPNKKLIIHFMQPHHPFMGPTADQVREEYDIRGYDNWLAHDHIEDSRVGTNMYELVERGEISKDNVHEAYGETLEIALEGVTRILSNINGKSVITSDHGEMLGERGFIKSRYGHPHDIYNMELRKVPWLTIESTDRREIISEDPIGFECLDDSTVNDQLRALGYVPE